jgi:hypothetical protein
MPVLRLVLVVVLPLLLASCDWFDDETPAPPAKTAAVPPKPGPAPNIPLRMGPETLLGFNPSDAKPTPSKPAPPPAPAPAAPQSSGKPPAHRDDLGEDDAQSFYEGVMLTYAFDACGLPLLGETARQDIAHRIEICPNTEARKNALRSLYKRTIATAENDPAKLKASAAALCKDKRAFLSNVMAHSQQLRFDDSQPPDCTLLSPRP